jgi:hypothetical protein
MQVKNAARFDSGSIPLAWLEPIRYSFIVPTVGEQLRQAREAQKLELHEVVDIDQNPRRPLAGVGGRQLWRLLRAGLYSRVRPHLRHLLKLDTAQILEQLGKRIGGLRPGGPVVGRALQRLAGFGHVPTVQIQPPHGLAGGWGAGVALVGLVGCYYFGVIFALETRRSVWAQDSTKCPPIPARPCLCPRGETSLL